MGTDATVLSEQTPDRFTASAFSSLDPGDVYESHKIVLILSAWEKNRPFEPFSPYPWTMARVRRTDHDQLV
jgi:hypothetical protein